MIQVITKDNLGSDFDFGTVQASKINVKLDPKFFARTVDGLVSFTPSAIISTDSGNILVSGTDGGVFMDAEAVQDAIGLAIAAGVGITYDDAMNAVKAAVANLAGGSTQTATVSVDTAGVVTTDVKLDSDGLLAVTSSGLAVDATALNTYLSSDLAVDHTVLTPDTGEVQLKVAAASVSTVPTLHVYDVFGNSIGFMVK